MMRLTVLSLVMVTASVSQAADGRWDAVAASHCPWDDCCHEPTSYADALAKALKENKPLVVWVGGGDALCPACIQTLKDEAIHCVTQTLPDTPTKALVVAFPENGQMWRVATITQWTTGDATWGHVPSIRRAMANWRSHRRVVQSGWSTDLTSYPPQAVSVLANFRFASPLQFQQPRMAVPFMTAPPMMRMTPRRGGG